MSVKKDPPDESYLVPRVVFAIGVVLVPAAIVAACYFLYSTYQVWAREEPRRVPPGAGDELPPPEELDRVVRETNKRLTTSKILAGGVGIDGIKPAARFTIATDHPNSYFQSMEYIIEAGADKPTARICELLKEVDQRKDLRALEALDRINTEVGIGPTGVAFKANGPLRAIFEILFAIRSVTEVPKKRAQILLRGYADAGGIDWEREQEPGDYRFNRVMALYPVSEEINSYNPHNFEARPKPIWIPDKYKNEHLPNLRAEFFKNDFILKLLRDCDAGDSIDVFILKGYEFKRKRDDRERRVDVQVNLF